MQFNSHAVIVFSLRIESGMSNCRKYSTENTFLYVGIGHCVSKLLDHRGLSFAIIHLNDVVVSFCNHLTAT